MTLALAPTVVRRLLWIDGGGAALAGVLVLVASRWLSDVYRLPLDFVRFIALINLLYACYSLSLAAQRRRPRVLIGLLAIGNTVWALLCFRWAFIFFDAASVFGLVQLIGEGLYVGGLGVVEWHYRDRLLEA